MAGATLVDKFGLLNTTLDRKFRIERVIAEGGFGVLYYGTHLMLDRPIALKVLKTPPDFNEQARASFMEGFAREAKTIVRISHPNIVQVLDFGVSEMPASEMAPWMALEWLNGPTLREVLIARRGQGGASAQEVLGIMKPALEALAYAHEEGVAHRDLKPANMMLVPTKRGNVLKLLDFGIAKVMEEGEEAGSGQTMTTSSLKAFSLAYAAPEQIGGSRTGPWTDVHAMALIITEMLTDQPPYDGKERTEICCDALSSRRPTPMKRNKDAGPWENVLNRALALKPADRFGSAGEFLAALEESLRGVGAFAMTMGAGFPAMPVPPGTMPPGMAPPAGMKPGTFPPGMVQPGMVPPGTMPPGMVQPGTYPPGMVQPGTMPPGMMMPPNAVPPTAGGDPGGNPTTLRGSATSRDVAQGAKGGGAKWLIFGLVGLGVMGGGAALVMQLRARSAAEQAAHAVATASPPVNTVTTRPMPTTQAGTVNPVVPTVPVNTALPANNAAPLPNTAPANPAQPNTAPTTPTVANTSAANPTAPANTATNVAPTNPTAPNNGTVVANANPTQPVTNTPPAQPTNGHGSTVAIAQPPSDNTGTGSNAAGHAPSGDHHGSNGTTAPQPGGHHHHGGGNAATTTLEVD